jgi:hypothetical protein
MIAPTAPSPGSEAVVKAAHEARKNAAPKAGFRQNIEFIRFFFTGCPF